MEIHSISQKDMIFVMNDKIKLTYLLFSVYLSVLCSLRPFGAILNDLSFTGGT